MEKEMGLVRKTPTNIRSDEANESPQTNVATPKRNGYMILKPKL
jgi:hypothetical protein